MNALTMCNPSISGRVGRSLASSRFGRSTRRTSLASSRIRVQRVRFSRMSPTRLQLPHTPGCLVCGRNNDFGLKLSLFVDPATGVVSVDFAAEPQHIGFEGIVHGGLIATVIDEAMVWAATWNGKRFCVCGELSVRFRRPAQVGEP